MKQKNKFNWNNKKLDDLVQALSPEFQLMTACGLLQEKGLSSQKIRTLVTQVCDWEWFLELLKQHRTWPLISHNLQKYASDLVPPSCLEFLQKKRRAIIQKNLSLLAELQKLKKIFTEHNIPFLPFKGITLSLQQYQDLSYRHLNDLDILVPVEKIPQIYELLLEKGYQSESGVTLKRKYFEGDLLEHYHVMVLISPQNHILEIHWRFHLDCHGFKINYRQFWENALFKEIGNHRFLALSKEDELIFLCWHAAKHRWERLKWLCDIAETLLLQSSPLDWTSLMNRAKELNGEKTLIMSVWLASRLFQLPMPLLIQERVQEEKLLQKLIAHGLEEVFLVSNKKDLTKNISFKKNIYEKFKYYFFRSHFSSSWKYKLGIFKAILCIDLFEMQMIPLPQKLFFLYYFLKPIFPLLRIYQQKRQA